jgi:GTP cyclohydrolase I
MRRAVRDFLTAAGLDLSDPNLRETPERVVETWIGELLDGYRTTPEEALGETYPAPEGSGADLVVVSGLRFHSMCPHHLLPFQGTAHVAYVPGERIVGFGRLGVLVDCFAHRLILQEELARQVARSLVTVLGSPGAACILDAEHGCMRIKSGRNATARTHSEAYEGVLRTDRELRRALWSRLA